MRIIIRENWNLEDFENRLLHVLVFVTKPLILPLSFQRRFLHLSLSKEIRKKNASETKKASSKTDL